MCHKSCLLKTAHKSQDNEKFTADETSRIISTLELSTLVPMKPAPPPETAKKVAFKKMMDFVKGDDNSQVANNQREMNQKLQIMLEETLTKNMHLQQVGYYRSHNIYYNIYSYLSYFYVLHRSTGNFYCILVYK